MIGQIFRKYRARIAATYTVLIAEFTVFALLPWLLGKAVDGMLRREFAMFYLYLCLRAGSLIVGFIRRRLDTRVFMRIMAENTTGAIRHLLGKGVHPTKVISRSSFIKTYSDFYEYTVPSTIQTVMEMAISFIMLTIALASAGAFRALAIITAMALVAVYVSFQFSHWVQKVEVKIQNIRERTDRSIVEQNIESACTLYDQTRVQYIRRSDLEAFSWGLNDILTVSAEIIVAFTVVTSGLSIGTIMATLSYAGKLFWRAGFISTFFNQLKQVEIANDLLRKED